MTTPKEFDEIAEQVTREFIKPHAERLGRVEGVHAAIVLSISSIQRENAHLTERMAGMIDGLKMVEEMLRAALEDNLDQLVETAKAWNTGIPEGEAPGDRSSDDEEGY